MMPNALLILLLQNDAEQVVTFDPPDMLLLLILAAAWILSVRVAGYRFWLPGWVANLHHPFRLRVVCWASALFLLFDTAAAYWFEYRLARWSADVFLLILGVIVVLQAIAVAVLVFSWGRRVGV